MEIYMLIISMYICTRKHTCVLFCFCFCLIIYVFIIINFFVIIICDLKKISSCSIATIQQCLYATPYKTVYFSDIPQEKTIKTSSNSRRGQRAACLSL